MDTLIADSIKQLLEIVNHLHCYYPKKRFTLDGRLVGDLGEVIVEKAYDLQLYEGIHKRYDGITSDGREVQIKATMKEALTYPADHTPTYYLGIKINSDGTFKEIFNGPGKVIAESLKNRKPTKNNIHTIPINTLEQLNTNIQDQDRVLRRDRNGIE